MHPGRTLVFALPLPPPHSLRGLSASIDHLEACELRPYLAHIIAYSLGANSKRSEPTVTMPFEGYHPACVADANEVEEAFRAAVGNPC